ncbi:MAG TPA: hypothetical protein PKZ84_17475 [Anaerolineae bacterium]|nr:hypothetical protein [Anaerolineae bacterium]HQI86358.1 hypothetical protein [Anaerolineae bacterium]
MLEILALWALTKKIGAIAEAKGHKSGGYKVLTVVLWFGGELIGAVIGAFIGNGDTCATYAIAIAGAAMGAGIAYLIASGLSEQYPQQ